jgi:fructose-bisphosphate aldolase class II
MPLVRTAEIVTAQGICAFNVITLEHAEAIVAGAEAAGLPVILQISENAVKFHGGRVGPIAAATAAVARQSTVDCSLHLDHVESKALLHEAPQHGFSSVMFDASTLDYADNVVATKAAAQFAHGQGLWLESELGEVGGKDGAHAPGARTDPREAAEYVAATGVDALAVAVGSSHAMTSRDAALDHELIARAARNRPRSAGAAWFLGRRRRRVAPRGPRRFGEGERGYGTQPRVHGAGAGSLVRQREARRSTSISRTRPRGDGRYGRALPASRCRMR